MQECVYTCFHVCMFEEGRDASIYQQMNTDARFNLTAIFPPCPRGKLSNITMSLYQILSIPSLKRLSAFPSLNVKPLSQLSSFAGFSLLLLSSLAVYLICFFCFLISFSNK